MTRGAAVPFDLTVNGMAQTLRRTWMTHAAGQVRRSGALLRGGDPGDNGDSEQGCTMRSRQLHRNNNREWLLPWISVWHRRQLVKTAPVV